MKRTRQKAGGVSRSGASGRKLTGIYTRGKTFWFTYRQNGKKHFHSLGTDDYGQAVQKALEIRQTPVLAPVALFDREIEAFIAHKVAHNEYSEDSAATKIYALRELARAKAQGNPAALTTADITSFYKMLQGRRTEATAQGYLTTIRSFYNWLVEEGKVRVNPVNGVKLARLDAKGRTKFCSRELRDRLIAECPREDLRLVLLLGFHAGLRKREIVEARPDWVDLESGKFEVRKTPTFRPKDREERTLPMTKMLLAYLSEQGLQSPFLLHPEAEKGKSKYRYDFRRPFDSFMKEMGVPWVTPHVMRHTFASLLASAGVSIFKIAKWMGDGVRVVERNYAKLSPDDGDIEKAHS